MKKVLLATTALVATAGMAAAQVELSGSAEIGVVGGDGMETQFFNDLDVKFIMSGETDNGLTFGATIDLDEVGDDCDSTVSTLVGSLCSSGDAIGATPTGSGPVEEHSVFISGGFGTVTMGDTDGAFDWAMKEVTLAGGSINDAEEHPGWSGNSGLDGANDGQILRYDYSFGDFSVAASLELDDSTGGTADDIFGIGLKYSADLGGIGVGFGVGYQDGGSTFGDVTGVSVDADFGNGFVAAINYWDMSTGTDYTAIGVGYTTGAIAVGVNYGEFSTGVDGFGVAATYDLGGGAEVQFGYGSGGGATTTDTWSLGVAMSF